MKLLLATTSAGKIREQLAILNESAAAHSLDVVSLRDLDPIDEPDEPGPTFEDNARVKALYYHRKSGLPALGEDSGIVIDALGGEPGVHSARWMGHDTPYDIKNQKILERLSGVTSSERTARYVSAVSFVNNDRVVFTAVETCEGRIADEPAGDGGFGYDPIFFFPPFDQTMAQIDPSRKNAVSHRGKSMAAFLRYLANQNR